MDKRGKPQAGTSFQPREALEGQTLHEDIEDLSKRSDSARKAIPDKVPLAQSLNTETNDVIPLQRLNIRSEEKTQNSNSNLLKSPLPIEKQPANSNTEENQRVKQNLGSDIITSQKSVKLNNPNLMSVAYNNGSINESDEKSEIHSFQRKPNETEKKIESSQEMSKKQFESGSEMNKSQKDVNASLDSRFTAKFQQQNPNESQVQSDQQLITPNFKNTQKFQTNLVSSSNHPEQRKESQFNNSSRRKSVFSFNFDKEAPEIYLIQRRKAEIELIKENPQNFHCFLRVWIRIKHYFQYRYPLSMFVYKTCHMVGEKGSIFFGFQAFCFNNFVFSFLAFLWFLLQHQSDQLERKSLRDYSYYIFNEFTENTASSYIICSFLYLFVQIVFAFFFYDYFSQRSVRAEAHYTQDLYYFNLLMAEWNWKIKGRKNSLLAQLSLKNKLSQRLFYDREKSTIKAVSVVDDKELQKPKIEVSEGFLVFIRVICVIFCVVLVGVSLFLIKEIHDKDILYKPEFGRLFHELPLSFVVVLLSFTCARLFNFVTYIEGWDSYRTKSFVRHYRIFFTKFLIIILFLVGKLLIVYPQYTSVPFIDRKEPLISAFNCRIEQFAYTLISLQISLAFINLVSQYLPAVFQTLKFLKICLFDKSHIFNQYAYKTEFHLIDSSIPYILLNMLILFTIPVAPVFSLVGALVFLFSFFYNWLWVFIFKLPYFSELHRVDLMRMVYKFYVISLCASFAFYCVFYSLNFQNENFPLKIEVPQNSQFDVGNDGEFLNYPYAFDFTNKTCSNRPQFINPLSLSQYLANNFIVVALYDLLNFTQFLQFLVILFLVIILVQANSKSEWKNEYFFKFKELKRIKGYYAQYIIKINQDIYGLKKELKNMRLLEFQKREIKEEKEQKDSDSSESSDKSEQQQLEEKKKNNKFSIEHVFKQLRSINQIIDQKKPQNQGKNKNWKF